jgi:hypothetical protein
MTDSTLDDAENEQDSKEEVHAMEDLATFDQFVVWSHGQPTAEADDPYAKAIQEWITLAEAVNSP